MTYSVKADLEKEIDAAKLVQLADDDGTGAGVAAVVSEAIARADAIIDSYLATRYALPLSPVPALVRTMSADVALYFLFTRRDQMTDVRRDAYTNALKLLKQIADGTAALGAPDAAGDQGGPVTNRVESDRVFTLGRPSTGLSGTLDRF